MKHFSGFGPTSAPPRAGLLFVGFALLAVLLLPHMLLAQIEMGGVTGTVKDPSSAAVADATVSLSNTQTGVVQTTKSTTSGTYGFQSVPVGNYTLRVEREGFQSVLT